MRKIKIVADSSCDMFELKHTGFETAPMKIITDEREFVDDVSLDVDDMANYLYQFKGKRNPPPMCHLSSGRIKT